MKRLLFLLFLLPVLSYGQTPATINELLVRIQSQIRAVPPNNLKIASVMDSTVKSFFPLKFDRFINVQDADGHGLEISSGDGVVFGSFVLGPTESSFLVNYDNGGSSQNKISVSPDSISFRTNNTNRFALENTGAWSVGGNPGTATQVLTSNGSASPPTWENASGGTWGTITGTLSNQTDLQTALDLKAPLASPAFTGTPTAPTPSAGDNSTKIATTAYVDALTALADGNIVVGNSSGVATGVNPSGVVDVSNTGAFSFPIERWKVTGTTSLTGATTIDGAFNLDFSNARRTETGTYTTIANSDYMFRRTGTVTARATASDAFRFYNLDGTMVSGAANQNAAFFRLAPTFTTTGGAFGTAYAFEVVGTSGSTIVNSTGALLTNRGLSFDVSSSAGANNIQFAAGTGGQISSAGSNSLTTFTGGTSTQASSATRRWLFNHTFAPVSGSNNVSVAQFVQTINQTGTANGATDNVMIATTPTAVVGAHTQLLINTTSGVTSTGDWTGIRYNPTVTSIGGVHYAATFSSGRVGIGTATPNSNLQTSSFATGYVAKTGAYDLDITDHTVEVTSGTHTQTLPTAVGITGRIYVITNSGSGTVTVATTSSQTFVNVTATPTTLTLNQFQTVTVQSNGANWLRLSTL